MAEADTVYELTGWVMAYSTRALAPDPAPDTPDHLILLHFARDKAGVWDQATETHNYILARDGRQPLTRKQVQAMERRRGSRVVRARVVLDGAPPGV